MAPRKYADWMCVSVFKFQAKCCKMLQVLQLDGKPHDPSSIRHRADSKYGAVTFAPRRARRHPPLQDRLSLASTCASASELLEAGSEVQALDALACRRSLVEHVV